MSYDHFHDFFHEHDAPRAQDVLLLDFADPGVQARIEELIRACEASDEISPFGDHEVLAIAAGGREGHVGMGIGSGDVLDGYAHLSRLGSSWFAEVAVRPDRRGLGLATRLLDAVVAHVAADGGGSLSTWAYRMDAPTAGLARHLGLRPERTLFQLRLSPLPLSAPDLPPGYVLDRFVPGRDDDAWLSFNAVSFAHLPDQGAWSAQDLDNRLTAPWFRQEDFLLVRDEAGEIAATCWCKIDPEVRTPDGEQLGEIYVVAVAPGQEGHGLGKTLAQIALVHLRSRGAGVGMLYVDGRNTRAMMLYDSLGFTTHHEDVCLSVQVAAE